MVCGTKGRRFESSWVHYYWKDARVVESDRLEICCRLRLTGGSNPPLSVRDNRFRLKAVFLIYLLNFSHLDIIQPHVVIQLFEVEGKKFADGGAEKAAEIFLEADQSDGKSDKTGHHH